MCACVFAYFAYLRSTYHIKCPPIHKNDLIRHTKRDETTCALTTPTMLTHGDSTQGEGSTDTIYTIIHISIYVCVCALQRSLYGRYIFVVSFYRVDFTFHVHENHLSRVPTPLAGLACIPHYSPCHAACVRHCSLHSGPRLHASGYG